MRIRWISETDVSPARALGTTQVISDQVASGKGAPVVIYGAGVSARALVLGRYQRGDVALNLAAAQEGSVEVHRRLTGGPAAMLEPGVVYLSLCLRNASTLMECPPTRLLNRNVRGVLGGLTQLGAAAHYFGREWVSIEKRPVALVGWDRHPEGSVTLEFFVAVENSFQVPERLTAYPPRNDPEFLGKEPICLNEAWTEPKTVEELVRSIAEGHVDRYEGEFNLERASLGDDERELIRARSEEIREESSAQYGLGRRDSETEDDSEPPNDLLKWSKAREVPIGFVSAGMAKDAEGNVTDVQVAGDFFQDREAPELLRERLLGQAPEPQALVDAINGTWDMKRTIIEGLSELDPILKCMMEVR